MQFGHGARPGIGAGAIRRPCRLIRQKAGGFDEGGHIGQLMTGDLEIDYLFTELNPFLDIGKRTVEGAPRHTQRLGRRYQVGLAQEGRQLTKAPAFLDRKSTRLNSSHRQ